MSSSYTVTPQDLTNAAVSCNKTAEHIHTQLASLKTYVMSLGWEGHAHQNFLALMHDYDVYSNMLNNALRDIASGLQGNYVNYKETEEANLRSLRPVDEWIPPARFNG